MAVTSEEYALPDYIRPGAILRLYWNKDNPNNRRIHIRAIVDGDQVVFRWYSQRRGWRYDLDSAMWFWLLDNEGVITVVRRGADEYAGIT